MILSLPLPFSFIQFCISIFVKNIGMATVHRRARVFHFLWVPFIWDQTVLRMHSQYVMNLFVVICRQEFTCYMLFILKACNPVFTVASSIYIQEIHTDALSRIDQRGKYIAHTKVHNRFFFFFLFIESSRRLTCSEVVDYLDFVTWVTMSLSMLMCTIGIAQQMKIKQNYLCFCCGNCRSISLLLLSSFFSVTIRW